MKKVAVVVALSALALFIAAQDAEACKKGRCCAPVCCSPCYVKCCTPCCVPCAPCHPCAPACPPCSGGACKACAHVTASDRAVLVVQLPEDAKLKIQDVATSSTSARRVFQSPALEKGKEYVYTLKASAIRNGKTVEVVKEVTVRAGSEVTVNLELDTVVAAK